MFIFQGNSSISICLKNNNPYVRLAVEDLRNDFLRVSFLTELPAIVQDVQDGCLVIEQNSYSGNPCLDESFSITRKGNVVTISANTYLGTMWGIYTFSEKVLGVHPCYLFNDLETEKRRCLEVGDISLLDAPKSSGFRGIFINDEDLLTAWKEGGGIRPLDYPWYGITVAPSVMDMVVETALRLRLNLVIPASFLNVDNPPEKALADCVAKRGIFLSQHHIEPVGLSHFTYEYYCKKFNKEGQYSFINNPDVLMEAWKAYAEKWAQYDNVVWQVGLRGKADRPVWEEENPNDEELKTYAAYINQAVKTQKEIIMQATNGKAKYFSTTLWMEGSTLMEKGLLEFGNDTIIVFSDNGPNQMFGCDYDKVPRVENMQYGIYYHLQYHDMGPHIVPQTGLKKLYYNLKKAKDKGDDRYFILNVSNVREFEFEMKAYAEMLWDFQNFSTDGYVENYAQTYGEEREQAKAVVETFFKNLPSLDTQFLRYVHAQYFNYNYGEISPGIKNFILKDELVMVKGSEMVWHFRNELPSELYGKMHAELTKVLPVYEQLCADLERWSMGLEQRLQRHVQCKWWLYAKTLVHFYRWFIGVYEAKLAYDENDANAMMKKLNEACESLEEYLSFRKCAEYGPFENWYRGDLKMNVRQRLYDTRRLLGQNAKDC